jgi:hypothetical protein
MDIFAQIFAAIVVVSATWYVFQFVGLKRDSLFYSRSEKAAFDERLSGNLGSYATIVNIIGTLTSLATVYVFFIGTSKVFGYYVFACVISIVLGAFVTKFFTRKILAQAPVRVLYARGDQIRAVLPSIFWGADKESRRNAALLRYLSLANIAGVLWLEFAVFSDLTGLVYAPGTHSVHAGVFFVSSFIVTYFIMQFGLRGFVFADMLQAPIVGLATLVVFVAILLSLMGTGAPSMAAFGRPLADNTTTIIFVIHVFVVNLFVVLVTEGHWMRVWLFGDKATNLQVRAIGTMSAGWVFLILVGLLGGLMSTNSGVDGVADVIRHVGQLFPFVSFAFWMAAIAALFSSADAAVFSFLLVRAFSPSEGNFKESRTRRPNSPFWYSLVAALAGSAVYYLVRVLGLPPEKLIFIAIPFCLNLLPSLVCRAYGRKPRLVYTLVATLGYVTISVYGLFLQANDQFAATLIAAICPILVSIIAPFIAEAEALETTTG